jgi:hypothetical protein
LIVALVAAQAPLVHGVALWSAESLKSRLIDADHLRLFARPYSESLIGTRQFAFASPHRNDSGRGIRLDIDAIFTSAQQREGRIGGVHLKGVLIAEIAEPDNKRSLGQAKLHVGVVQVKEFDSGRCFHPEGGAADLQFSRPGKFHKHLVSGGEGPVVVDGSPIVHARRTDRNRSVYITDPRYTPRRVGLTHQKAGR